VSATVGALLDDAATRIGAEGVEGDPRRDAQVLLGHALGVSRAWLTAHAAEAVDPTGAERFRLLVSQRQQGRPVAYLTGKREFYGRDFRVGDAVLIPRPETELLVEAALQRLPPGSPVTVLDLGTGSGCIALTLALERPALQVTAVEASATALDIARTNAAALGAQVELLHGDWYAAVPGRRFDLIVSNPPYVADADPHLARGDLRAEPRLALAAGTDGLRDIRRIVASATGHLQSGGWLLLEHGHDQGPACRDLLQGAGFGELLQLDDLAGLPRVSGGRLERATGSR
jgi:release factor glutamine methyltransferase